MHEGHKDLIGKVIKNNNNKLISAIKKADVFVSYDWPNDTIVFISCNKKDPLTDEERELIKKIVAPRKIRFAVARGGEE